MNNCLLCKDMGMVASPGDWKENGSWEDCPVCVTPQFINCIAYANQTKKPTGLRWVWRWFQARFRLNLDAVCEMSVGKGLCDYHDYPDSIEGYPDHFVVMKCVRCNKEFSI